MTNIQSSERPSETGIRGVSFSDWIGGRSVDTLGTNAGAEPLPFQGWRHFKEAFAPELIQRAISESPIAVQRCIDPFGGSGTTALACQFLGVRPTTIEINPYLADLIEAKLATYNVETIAGDFATLVKSANMRRLSARYFFAAAPATFVEPGLNDRWIFGEAVANRIAAYVASLPAIENAVNRRLFRVLLGGILVDISNVIVSGKGRRYRRKWEDRNITAAELDEAFCQAVEIAVGDIVRFGVRSEHRYSIVRGDARSAVNTIKPVDIAIFSPPYPNSFDYTDVYNVELWALQYLRNGGENTALRRRTLSSHVQIKRRYADLPVGSARLEKGYRALNRKRDELWNPDIPEMVGGYFADMVRTLKAIANRLPQRGQIWMVVGDSRYAGVSIPVADILIELAESAGCSLVTKEPFRSMRTSAQQGGAQSLSETLVVLARN